MHVRLLAEQAYVCAMCYRLKGRIISVQFCKGADLSIPSIKHSILCIHSTSPFFLLQGPKINLSVWCYALRNIIYSFTKTQRTNLFGGGSAENQLLSSNSSIVICTFFFSHASTTYDTCIMFRTYVLLNVKMLNHANLNISSNRVYIYVQMKT